MLTDDEIIEKLKEEKLKLTEELTQAQEETKRLENEIKTKTSQSTDMEDDKKQ